MTGRPCHFHMDEWCVGTRLAEGSYAFTCELRRGHPGEQPWSWLETPASPEVGGLTGLAEELDLEQELPAALAALGDGWFEYGLVERSYADRCPDGFRRMVEQWGHTALDRGRPFTASAYIARTLGQLGRTGVVAYHPGRGTGRWSYNEDISWWSTVPPGDWSVRTAWVAMVADDTPQAQDADAECSRYVGAP